MIVDVAEPHVHEMGIVDTAAVKDFLQIVELAPQEHFRPRHASATTPPFEIGHVGVDREQRLIAHATVVVAIAVHDDCRNPDTILHDGLVLALRPPLADIDHHLVPDVEVVVWTQAHQVGLLGGSLLEVLKEPDTFTHFLTLCEIVLDFLLEALHLFRDFGLGLALKQAGRVELRFGRSATEQAA